MAIKVNIIKKEAGHFVVAVEGRLDSETAPQCEAGIKHLLAPATKVLTFDFKHLDYISSMGLRVIVAAMKAIAKQKGRVVVRNAQPRSPKSSISPDSFRATLPQASARPIFSWTPSSARKPRRNRMYPTERWEGRRVAVLKRF